MSSEITLLPRKARQYEPISNLSCSIYWGIGPPLYPETGRDRYLLYLPCQLFASCYWNWLALGKRRILLQTKKGVDNNALAFVLMRQNQRCF